jgi:hypothetical protein
MAELEYKGIRLGGSKLLLLIPLLTTILGGAYTIFEGYSRYQAMEAKINKFVSPDLTSIEASIIELSGESEITKQLVREQINSMKSQVSVLQTNIYDLKLELKDDLTRVSDRVDTQLEKQTNILDQQDTRNRANVQIVRDIITAFEGRMDNKITRLDEKLDNLEQDLDERITYALNNPLSN